MTSRDQSSMFGVLLAMGGCLVVAMGLVCMGGAGFFFFRSSPPMPVAPTAVKTVPTVIGLQLRSSAVLPQPDGSYKIVLSGSFPGPYKIDQLKLDQVSIVELPGRPCAVQLPPGPPYPPDLDFFIQTPPLPADQRAITLNYSVNIQASESSFSSSSTFGMSNSDTLKVTLKDDVQKTSSETVTPEPPAKKPEVKAEAFPE